MSDSSDDPAARSEEVQAAARRAYADALARQSMAATDAGHRTGAVLRELSVEQGAIVLAMLGQIVAAGPEAAVRANWFSGYLVAIRSEAHGICPSCRVNHDDEFAAAMTPPSEEGPSA